VLDHQAKPSVEVPAQRGFESSRMSASDARQVCDAAVLDLRDRMITKGKQADAQIAQLRDDVQAELEPNETLTVMDPMGGRQFVLEAGYEVERLLKRCATLYP
jgi:hypothetical protein